MQPAKPNTQHRPAPTRSFTWSIETADIEFMRTGAVAALEGSSGGGDCSAISDFDPKQHRKPAPAVQR